MDIINGMQVIAIGTLAVVSYILTFHRSSQPKKGKYSMPSKCSIKYKKKTFLSLY